MAQAIPLAGAAIGNFFGGNFGGQVGWMIGATVMNAVQPKPVQRAGDPSTAPQVGSDIRGQTIPFMMGTVRAPGYIIWQNNFRAVKNTRKVGSGKQKGKQEFYTYDSDFIFHMGLTPTDYRIIGMWEGTERINDQSIAAITMADGSEYAGAPRADLPVSVTGALGARFFIPAYGPDRFANLQGAAAKTMSFTEAYYFGGHSAVGSTPGWAYFQSAQGAPNVRWPHTSWFGVRAFDLGDMPRIPPLNFEVQPATEPSLSGGWSDTNVCGPIASESMVPVGITIGGACTVFSSVSDVVVIRVVSNTVPDLVLATLSGAQIEADFPSANLGNTNLGFIGALMVPGTNVLATFFAGVGQGSSGGQISLRCYTVDPDSGVLTTAGYCALDAQDGSTNVSQWWTQVYCCGLDANQQFLFVVGQQVTTNDVHVTKFPFPPVAGNLALADVWDVGGDYRKIISGLDKNFMDTAETYWPFDSGQPACCGMVLPFFLTESCYLYFYVNKARIRWALDNPSTDNTFITAQAATYPNGFFCKVLITQPFTVGSVEIAHADFTSNAPPFADAALNIDGSDPGAWTSGFDAVDYSEQFYPGPSNFQYPGSDWVVIFHRQLDTPENCTRGACAGVRGYSWNPGTGEFDFINSITLELEDVSLKFNVAASQKFDTLLNTGAMVAYDPQFGGFLRVGARQSSAFNGYAAFMGRVRLDAIDYTPPEIIKEIFCNNVIGFGQPETLIDSTSYNAAVEFCEKNGILVSGIWANQTPRTEVFEQLVSVYGGWVAWTGTYLRFGNLTEVVSPVRTIDNFRFRQEERDEQKPPFNVSRQAKQDTVNRVTVKYQDRRLAYRDNEVTLDDEVDQDDSGPRARIVNTGLVMTKDTAYRMADRILFANLYARNVYDRVPVGWQDADILPGDVITLVDSFSQTNNVVRVARREEVGRGKYDLTCVDELDYLATSKPNVEAPDPTLRGVPTNTDRPLDFVMYELPPEFSPSGPRYFVGWAPGGATAAAGLYTSASTTGFRLQQSVAPYPDAGRTVTYLPPTADVVLNARVLINARSSSLVGSSGYWFTGDLENYNALDRATGLSLLRIGSEMLSYEGATLIGNNVWQFDRLYRGVGGSPVSVHSAGDVFWAHNPADGGGLFVTPYGQEQIGTTIFYKVVPVGFDGVEFDPSSVAYKSYTLRGTHFAPIAMNDLRVLVGSPSASLPAYLPVGRDYFATTSLYHINPRRPRNVGSGEGRNITLVWPETSRTSGYGIQGYGDRGYGNFVDDSPLPFWAVTIIGSGGNIVGSATVNSPYFAYDATTNAAANGAWHGAVAFSVLPKNAYADAPYPAVVSLNLQG